MNKKRIQDTAARVNDREQQYTQVSYDPIDTHHFGAINTPIYQTSLFAFETYEAFEQSMKDLQNNHVYSRGNNPTVSYLENKLAELEGGEQAKCFASGMAAISSAILSVVSSGDHVVCVNQVYGPTREFLSDYLRRFDVETTFIDGSSIANWENAVQPNTKLFYLESPTSLVFELQDLQACTTLARKSGAVTIIDNTWATPFYQKPLEIGVDLVVHSISKYLGGHSDLVGGVVIGARKWMERIANVEYMLLGGLMTPQTAALVSRGLRTLPLRLERHEASALLVAEHLQGLPIATRVNHPGLPGYAQYDLAIRQMSGTSGLFSFESDKPIEQLKQWASELRYFKIGVSWGGFESLVTVNRVQYEGEESARHIVRLHIGLEDPQELIRDIDEACRNVF